LREEEDGEMRDFYEVKEVPRITLFMDGADWTYNGVVRTVPIFKWVIAQLKTFKA